MRDDDRLTLILNKIMEVSERTARIETKVESMQDDIDQIKAEDVRTNDILDIHVAGTVTNRERLEVEIENRKDLEKKVEIVDSRLGVVEEFPKFLKSFKALVVYVAACGSAIYTVGHLLGKW